MGRDRFEHHRQPCPCGEGSLVVEWTEHDVYGSSGMWETRVGCQECQKEFDLVIQDGVVILVESREIKRRKDFRREAWRIDEKILDSSHGRALRSELAALLDRQASMAAAHRLLRAADLTVPSIGRFREDVRNRGYADYVEREILSATELPKVARLVGRDLDPAVSEKLERCSELRREAEKPVQRIGDPIYRLRR